MFLVDLETYNDQEFSEAYTAGSFDVNRLRDRWDTALTPEEKEIEREYVMVFDGLGGNLIMNMPKYTSKNSEGDERIYINKEAPEIVSSYKILLLARNAYGFDSWVVLNSLEKKNKRFEVCKNC